MNKKIVNIVATISIIGAVCFFIGNIEIKNDNIYLNEKFAYGAVVLICLFGISVFGYVILITSDVSNKEIKKVKKEKTTEFLKNALLEETEVEYYGIGNDWLLILIKDCCNPKFTAKAQGDDTVDLFVRDRKTNEQLGETINLDAVVFAEYFIPKKN